MKNARSSEIRNLQTTREFDQLIEHGRKLHSKAVVTWLLKIFKLFRQDSHKANQPEEKQVNLKYSHYSRTSS